MAEGFRIHGPRGSGSGPKVGPCVLDRVPMGSPGSLRQTMPRCRCPRPGKALGGGPGGCSAPSPWCRPCWPRRGCCRRFRCCSRAGSRRGRWCSCSPRWLPGCATSPYASFPRAGPASARRGGRAGQARRTRRADRTERAWCPGGRWRARWRWRPRSRPGRSRSGPNRSSTCVTPRPTSRWATGSRTTARYPSRTRWSRSAARIRAWGSPAPTTIRVAPGSCRSS